MQYLGVEWRLERRGMEWRLGERATGNRGQEGGRLIGRKYLDVERDRKEEK